MKKLILILLMVFFVLSVQNSFAASVNSSEWVSQNILVYWDSSVGADLGTIGVYGEGGAYYRSSILINLSNWSTIYPGSTITDVKLSLGYVSKSATGTANLYYADAIWKRSNFTTNQPCGSPGSINTNNGCNITIQSTLANSDFLAGYNNFTITNPVIWETSQAWRDGIFSLTIVDNGESGNTDNQIYSSINSSAKPSIIITYTGGTSPIINNTIPNITIKYPSANDVLDNKTYTLYINGTTTIQNGSLSNLSINNTNWKWNSNVTNFSFSFNGSSVNGMWAISLMANSTAGNISYTNITFYIDNINPTAISNLEDGKSLFFIQRNATIQINFSDNNRFFEFNISDGENFNYNGSSYNTALYIFNGTVNNGNYSMGRHNITARFCDAHNSQFPLNCVTKSWAYYLYNYTAIYSASAVETMIEDIKLVIDFKDIVLSGNGTLNYNGVLYNTINSSSNKQLNLTIPFAFVSGINNQSNLSFFWNLYFNNSKSYTTINYSQLISRIQMVGCGALTKVPAINISIYDEQSPIDFINSQVTGTINAWTNDSNNFINFTFDFSNNSNYAICIYPNTSVSVNAKFFYNSTGGYKERWFLRNERISSNLTYIKMFNFATTTGVSEVQGTLRDSSFGPYANIISKLFRWYPSSNEWKLVQMDESDSFGQVVFHVIENSEDYYMSYYQDSQMIDSTDLMKFVCNNNLCTINMPVTSSIINQTAAPKFITVFDNSTSLFFVNYTDATGKTSSARLLVTKVLGPNTFTVCDTTSMGAYGSMVCNTSGYDGTLQAKIFTSASPETAKIIVWIYKQSKALFQALRGVNMDKEGIFWANGIVLTMEIAGFSFHPIAGIILGIIGLIGINLMQLTNYITNSIIILITVIGLVIALLISRRR
jgi:hypothetical protein